ncbi:MAG: ABC transporter ATP-binding protein, partial [Desulfobacterales bacterium]|nr:ABC transporter ATP-binding protein [Desulfobacterales bacterium]
SHLSVERNISFGLYRQGLSSDEISSRVEKNASMLGIRHLLKRRVAGLSGGEKQRTALARALTIEPRVLLLDEPVSALDENTRESVCMELHKLQRELGITTIHVSHNMEEAFSVADRGAILHDGSFEQIGTPDELLHQPSNSFVAQFMRCGNLYAGLAKGQGPEPDTTSVEVDGVEIVVPGKHHGNIKFIIRPENIQLQKANIFKTENSDTQIPVGVTNIVNRGTYIRLNCSGPLPIVVHLLHNSFREMALSEGDELCAVIPLRMIHVLGG